ncbi:MAG: hypothetical protein LUO89_08670 [Methanothrix sp.]|nr:hypothetical protein [Methanothrix sp.]
MKDERVYMLLDEFGASPAVPVTIAYMAKWFYPDLFPELDPKTLHQQYLDLQDFDYDLNPMACSHIPLKQTRNNFFHATIKKL